MTFKPLLTSSYELSESASRSSDELDDDPPPYEEDISSHLLTGQPVFDHRLANDPRPQYSGRQRLIIFLLYLIVTVLPTIIIIAYTVFPSYTYPPLRYTQLRTVSEASSTPGRGNPAGQKVFIAASLYDAGGSLANGAWSRNVLNLIDLLGSNNTFLSIYENDSGQVGKHALRKMKERVLCAHSLVSEDHLALEEMPQVTLPDGSKKVKRIAYLAEVRNRALKPLEESDILYDKILYLNDVVFDPIDAIQLLFATNNGRYRAACAVDFIMPFKFYDTFATRDLGGYGMGVPFFPWFSYNGDARTHADVLAGSDAVRVRSCWGGMVAFDARFFQKQPDPTLVPETAASESPSNLTAPYKFRAENDLYWDASECCLIQADIQSLDAEDRGIYMNPFVRVAYDTQTLSWLWFTRRFERMYTPIHILADMLVSLPAYNPRQIERPGERVEESIWVPNQYVVGNGSFQNVPRLAGHAGFCGRRGLPVMKDDWGLQEQNYRHVPVPSA